jgi:hypothetical protein
LKQLEPLAGMRAAALEYGDPLGTVVHFEVVIDLNHPAHSPNCGDQVLDLVGQDATTQANPPLMYGRFNGPWV